MHQIEMVRLCGALGSSPRRQRIDHDRGGVHRHDEVIKALAENARAQYISLPSRFQARKLMMPRWSC